MHLSKNKNRLISDLSILKTNLSIINSTMKNLAKYTKDSNLKNNQIFKRINKNNEEILDLSQFMEGCE